MKRKVSILRKKNGVLNQARFTLNKDILKTLNIKDEKENLNLIYKNAEIRIKRSEIKEEKIIYDKNKILKECTKNLSLIKSFSNREKEYANYNILIPLPVAKAMALDSNPTVNVFLENKEIRIKSGGIMSKVYTVKNNKGGISKTFTAVQIASGLALNGYKTLLATSDSQNNILHYTMKKEELEKYDMTRGLRHAVLFGDNEDLYIQLRKNLDFIPTESSVFSEAFEKKFKTWIEKKKEEYDYIIIDSIPTMEIDKKFVEYSDKIIIPTFCDYSTTEGILKVIEEAGAEKVQAVIISLYKNTKTQREYREKLGKFLEGTGICFPEPVKELSQIETLIEKGKTIWESKAKVLEEVQNSFLDVILSMIEK